MTKIKFEDKLKKLEEIVKQLESGEIDLDDAIGKYNEAMVLVKDCSAHLNDIEKNVNKILTESGNLEEFNVKE